MPFQRDQLHIIYNEIDSDIFGNVVADIKDFDANEDFARFEMKYMADMKPFYCLVKLPCGDVSSAHILEKHGFKFMEFQLKYTNIPESYEDDLEAAGYGYSEVLSLTDLDEVINIAGTTFDNDRIRIDSDLTKMYDFDIASLRYASYIKRSYMRDDQRVYKIYRKKCGTVVGFFSYFIRGGGRHLYSLGEFQKQPKGGDWVIFI